MEKLAARVSALESNGSALRVQSVPGMRSASLPITGVDHYEAKVLNLPLRTRSKDIEKAVNEFVLHLLN